MQALPVRILLLVQLPVPPQLRAGAAQGRALAHPVLQPQCCDGRVSGLQGLPQLTDPFSAPLQAQNGTPVHPLGQWRHTTAVPGKALDQCQQVLPVKYPAGHVAGELMHADLQRLPQIEARVLDTFEEYRAAGAGDVLRHRVIAGQRGAGGTGGIQVDQG